MLRAEWVTRVSALDLFIHEVIAQAVLEIFEGRRPVTPAFSRFQVSNKTMSRIRSASSETEASAAFDLHVRERLGRMTFQNPDDIAEGVKLCSTIDLWNVLALHLGATAVSKIDEAKRLKTILSLIVRRRNIIVHEGDLQPSPPREPLPIKREDLAFVCDQIESLAKAISLIV